jgi:hypothetical protein
MSSRKDQLRQLGENATSSKDTGPGVWAIIHMMCQEADEIGDLDALYALVMTVAKRFKATECRDHFKSFLEKNQIVVGKAFSWSIRAHNAVNERTGKLVLTDEEAGDIWSPSNVRIVPCSDNSVHSAPQQTKSATPSPTIKYSGTANYGIFGPTSLINPLTSLMEYASR